MLKEVMKTAKVLKKSGLFLGGVAFGTAGLKLLSSKDAKKMYSKAIAKGYKVKDEINSTVSNVKQHADDVMIDAKHIYETEKKELQLSEIKGE